MKIANANILTAYKAETIGTKITDRAGFREALSVAVASTDFGAQRVPGQAFIMLPETARGTVTAGCGRRTLDPIDYIARVHRGEVGLYLRRERAAKVEGLAVVVYTRDAYLADPDVAGDTLERARIDSTVTHVLVAVLAFAGPKSPLPKGTFIHNLAGGNKEAALYSADEIRAMATAIDAYWSDWCIVAD
jgi:hypothetical protein